ncbi:MAG: DUF1893 domain-containing protein [Paludibacteraceae bacterium]|nr:DUF1893 domain-containing protein [Paludibacteraceae bacterium]
MKFLFFLLPLCLVLSACSQAPMAGDVSDSASQSSDSAAAQGRALLHILNADSHSLVVLNHDSLSYYNGRGVSDLLSLLTDEPQRLQGAVVADKVVGRAAAMLMIASGVSEVHTNTVSTPALKALREAGISVSFDEEVPQILNRDLSGQCPIDASLSDADGVDQCVAILKQRFQN